MESSFLLYSLWTRRGGYDLGVFNSLWLAHDELENLKLVNIEQNENTLSRTTALLEKEQANTVGIIEALKVIYVLISQYEKYAIQTVCIYRILLLF
jgi:hypothetical protein